MNKSQHISQLDVQSQLDWIKEQFYSDEFIMNILSNPVVSEIGGYLGAGCVYQRIWNILTDRDLDYGIDDYYALVIKNLFYFRSLSYQ
jgi:hypothetical protein